MVRDLFRTPFVCSHVNDDELRARLRAFGEEPIDAQTRAVHQRLMAAAAGSGEREHRRGLVWAGIAGAAVVGFLAGSTGLAMADALPDPAQEVAHDVLGAVQVAYRAAHDVGREARLAQGGAHPGRRRADRAAGKAVAFARQPLLVLGGQPEHPPDELLDH